MKEFDQQIWLGIDDWPILQQFEADQHKCHSCARSHKYIWFCDTARRANMNNSDFLDVPGWDLRFLKQSKNNAIDMPRFGLVADAVTFLLHVGEPLLQLRPAVSNHRVRFGASPITPICKQVDTYVNMYAQGSFDGS